MIETLTVRIQAELAGYRNGLRKLRAETEKAQDQMRQRMKGDWSGLTEALGAVSPTFKGISDRFEDMKEQMTKGGKDAGKGFKGIKLAMGALKLGIAGLVVAIGIKLFQAVLKVSGELTKMADPVRYDRATAKMNQSIKRLKTSLGAILAPVYEGLSKFVSALADGLNKIVEGFATLIGWIKGFLGLNKTVNETLDDTKDEATSAADAGLAAFDKLNTLNIGEQGDLEQADKMADIMNKAAEDAAKIKDNIKAWFDNPFGNIADWFANLDLGGMFSGIADWFSNLGESAGGVWANFKKSASETWSNVKLWGSQTWSNVKAWGSETWSDIKDSASTAWNKIKDSASTKWTEIKTDIEDKWSDIKENVGTLWDDLKNTAETKWDEIKTTIYTKMSDVGSDIKDLFGDVWAEVGKAFLEIIKTITDKIENIKNKLLNLANFSPGTTFLDDESIGAGNEYREDTPIAKIPMAGPFKGLATGIKNAFSGIGSALSNVSSSLVSGFKGLLGHATGAVVEPNDPYVALLGDNKREREVVSPVSTMKSAMKEAIVESGGIGSSRPVNIELVIDGKTFARAVYNDIRNESLRRGQAI